MAKIGPNMYENKEIWDKIESTDDQVGKKKSAENLYRQKRNVGKKQSVVTKPKFSHFSQTFFYYHKGNKYISREEIFVH